MARKGSTQSISVHRNYTVDETSKAMGVHRQTVLRWIKSGKLSLIDDRKPFLILGSELIAFRREGKAKGPKCRLDQCWCFRCREPKGAAFGAGEIITSRGAALNVRMLCETCSAVMHKRVARPRIRELAAILDLTIPQALRHLIDT